jgi:formimidoylglutamate deiminase
VVIDTADNALLGVPPGQLLDALTFSGPSRPVRDVMVAGRWVVRERRHAREQEAASRFAEAMRSSGEA